ncbi:hypothetical protein M404DRAFT_53564, partial [Pisolithus tinctorius Marx 270]
VTGLSIRHVGEHFQRSNGTFSNGLTIVPVTSKKILFAFPSHDIYSKYIQLLCSDAPVHPTICNNPKFFPFFADAISAIDGMHIMCAPSSEERDAMRNRK